jgi:hypothetical protein
MAVAMEELTSFDLRVAAPKRSADGDRTSVGGHQQRDAIDNRIADGRSPGRPETEDPTPVSRAVLRWRPRPQTR